MSDATVIQAEADALRCAGRGDRAISRYQKARAMFLEAGEPSEAAECLHMLGVTYIFEDRYQEGRKTLLLALKERDERHRLVDGGRILRDLAIAEMLERHFFEALEFLTKSLDRLMTTDNFAEIGITRSKLGRLYSLTGEYALVDESFDEAYVLIGKADHAAYQMAVHIDNAFACLERIQFGHLDNHLAIAWRILEETGELKRQVRRVAQIYTLQIRSAVNKGQWGVAHTIYKDRLLNVLEDISPGNKASLDKELQISDLPQTLSLP